MAYTKTFSSNKYIEYQHGDLNLILLVPHGGKLKPRSIPTRDAGRLVNGMCVYDHASKDKDPQNCPIRFKKDSLTQELSQMLADELKKISGKRPHVVLNHLYRGKLDMNCDVKEAAFNVQEAEGAWHSFHSYINKAKDKIGDRGLVIDLHGHSHTEDWVELGYTLAAIKLNSGNYSWEDTSIRNLAEVHKMTEQNKFVSLISGPTSLGGFIADRGYKAVPSPSNPSPQDNKYYTGGFNTQIHGSRKGGTFDAIQVESPRSVRRGEVSKDYVRALANAIYQFLVLYYS